MFANLVVPIVAYDTLGQKSIQGGAGKDCCDLHALGQGQKQAEATVQPADSGAYAALAVMHAQNMCWGEQATLCELMVVYEVLITKE